MLVAGCQDVSLHSGPRLLLLLIPCHRLLVADCWFLLFTLLAAGGKK